MRLDYSYWFRSNFFSRRERIAVKNYFNAAFLIANIETSTDPAAFRLQTRYITLHIPLQAESSIVESDYVTLNIPAIKVSPSYSSSELSGSLYSRSCL